MSHYKPYPAYKDSGVEWLGRVPEHWEVSRLRFFAEINPPISKEVLADLDAEVSFLPMETIGENGSLNLEQTRPVAAVRNGYSYFENGDVAFAKVTPCFENGKGALLHSLVGQVGFGTTELTVLRRKSDTDARFINYIVQSGRFRAFGAGAMTGAGGLKRVPDEFTRNFVTAWPAPYEQSSIATHLDRETTQIDELLAKKARFIELLREKRQALITHAVTKGLNPTAKMKDSGVEWIGAIPRHWESKKLSNISKIVRGASPRPAGDPRYFASENESGDNTPWLTVAEITKDENRHVVSTTSFLTALGATQSQMFRAGILVFSNSGATLGVPKILDIDCCANDGVLAFRMLSSSVDINFIYYFLLTTTTRLREEMQKGGQPNLNTDIVKSMSFPCPPKAEQHIIVSHLEHATKRLDTLITKTELSLTLLKERRSALITAAVTGQIDLRRAS